MKQIVLEGYAPSDLVAKLAKAPWVSVIGGKNFGGIDLGAFALAEPSDAHCPIKYRISIQQIPDGPQFQVEGFCYQDLLEHIANESFPVVFDGRRLEDRSFAELRNDESAFRAIIQKIP